MQDPSDDPEGISEAAEYLIDELRELPVDRLGRSSDAEAPVGTRAGEMEMFDTIVALVSSPVVVKAFLDIIKSWLVRRARGQVKVKIENDEIELTAASSAEQRAIVEAFIRRHGSDE